MTEALRPQDNKAAVSYQAESERDRLDLTIFDQPCGNSSYNRKVKVSVQTGSNHTVTDYEGCGKYFGDYRLNDIWVLESINGDTLDQQKEAPNLEFQLTKDKVYGFGGCNRIEGHFETARDSLTIGRLSSTRKDCSNRKIEVDFLEAISNKTFSFTIADLRLKLIGHESVLIFKKAY